MTKPDTTNAEVNQPAPPWAAEQVVSRELAQALVDRQFPQLKPAVVEPLGIGWDNTAYRINRDYVFRLPRRQIAVDLIVAEGRLLPWVAPQLPVAVPVPIFFGRPDERFSWPFLGYQYLSGQTACTQALDDDQRRRLAPQIGRFLAALHAVSVDDAAARGAAPDPIHRLDIAGRTPKILDRLEQLARAGLLADVRPLQRAVKASASIPISNSRSLVHGDFYVRHLLVDDAGQLTGVIDWGDIHIGHRAVDLMVAHGFLPPASHDAFHQAYGPIDEATWELARFRALDHATTVAVFAHGTGQGDLLVEALTALARVA